MKFTIIGSGGCGSLPKPLCKCKICKEAREKGKPYSRFGRSLFLEEVTNYIKLDNIKLTFVKAASATVFVFEQGERKVIYAPYDVKPFPSKDIFKNADVMIIGNTIVGEVLKDGYMI